MADTCEVCQKELYTITTRRFGNHSLCNDCGDGPIGEKLHNGIEAVVSNIILAEKILIKRKEVFGNDSNVNVIRET